LPNIASFAVFVIEARQIAIHTRLIIKMRDGD